MSRASARELAVHLIYSREFTGEDPQQVIATRLNKEYFAQLAEVNEIYAKRPNSWERAYLDQVVAGVCNRCDELNEIIQNFSIDWDVSRISKLARTILQLAIFEIRFLEDVPTGVAISEAVRIAKLYDGDDTGSFVNGILGSYARSLNNEVEQ